MRFILLFLTQHVSAYKYVYKNVLFYIILQLNSTHTTGTFTHRGVSDTVLMVTTTGVIIKLDEQLSVINGRLAPDT